VTSQFTFEDTFPPNSKEATHKIERVSPPKPGYEVADVRVLTAKGLSQGPVNGVLAVEAVGTAKDLKLQLTPDRRSVRLTGELARGSAMLQRGAALANVVVRTQITYARRNPVSRAPVPVAANLALPGSTTLALPPLPRSWAEPQRQ